MSPGTSQHSQLVVIGGGPAGYPAAFAAADLGMQVTLINDDIQPGGVCLHRGCIPSKALLHVAKLIRETQESHAWGVTFEKPTIDLQKLREFKAGIVNKLTGGIGALCKARGVNLIRGRGELLSSNSVQVKTHEGAIETISFDHAIVATGSRPTVPPIFDVNDPRVMDSRAALQLEEIPKRLLVIGGGYIGLEMGSVYSALGSEVTVVEMLPKLLAAADQDLVGPLKNKLTEYFSAIHLNTRVAGLTPKSDGIEVQLEGEGVDPTQTFDRVLISIGRRPNSGGIGIENTKAMIDEKGFIEIDNQCRTNDERIFAIGDVAGEPMLAHKATREAKIAVEAMAGEPAEFDNIAIPAVVFTDPELAWCGLTETEAKAAGHPIKVTRFPWAASGRAQTLARTEGLTKIIFDAETERVLGVGIVGPGAGELIGEGVLAVETAAVARDLADTIHAHPTLAETIMESAELFYGQATHLFRAKRK